MIECVYITLCKTSIASSTVIVTYKCVVTEFLAIHWHKWSHYHGHLSVGVLACLEIVCASTGFYGNHSAVCSHNSFVVVVVVFESHHHYYTVVNSLRLRRSVYLFLSLTHVSVSVRVSCTQSLLFE